MGCLGNVLWFVFGGAVSGLSWCLAGCLWCITVVGSWWAASPGSIRFRHP